MDLYSVWISQVKNFSIGTPLIPYFSYIGILECKYEIDMNKHNILKLKNKANNKLNLKIKYQTRYIKDYIYLFFYDILLLKHFLTIMTISPISVLYENDIKKITNTEIQILSDSVRTVKEYALKLQEYLSKVEKQKILNKNELNKFFIPSFTLRLLALKRENNGFYTYLLFKELNLLDFFIKDDERYSIGVRFFPASVDMEYGEIIFKDKKDKLDDKEIEKRIVTFFNEEYNKQNI
jgi:hypothetical protein